MSTATVVKVFLFSLVTVTRSFTNFFLSVNGGWGGFNAIAGLLIFWCGYGHGLGFTFFVLVCARVRVG